MYSVILLNLPYLNFVYIYLCTKIKQIILPKCGPFVTLAFDLELTLEFTQEPLQLVWKMQICVTSSKYVK